MRRWLFQTYHIALCWIWNLADASGKLVRWRLQISKFKSIAGLQLGVKHRAADALWRPVTNGHNKFYFNDAFWYT